MTVARFSGVRGLPRDTRSICPECGKIVPARVFEEDGSVFMEKVCQEHGSFRDVYWSDVELYLRAERWGVDGTGVENPDYQATSDQCPFVCGLCSAHLSTTNLANIDLTNRCNLNCPICFANANASGYVFEPTFDQIVSMLKKLRDERPVPTPAVQFSGGEPTIYPRFLDVIRVARDMGFTQIQVATNGVLLARRDGFAQEMADAGLHTVYLQFDGLREENYIAARGVPLLNSKIKAVENCRKVRPKPLAVVLVPTIVNTINDDQVGAILDFAIRNRDVIRGVNYQPVAFTGRIDEEARERERFTLSDLAIRLEEQTEYLTRYDFYPVPSVVAISRLVSAIQGPKVAFTSHPHCGIATFLVIDERGHPTPINRFVDVDGMLKRMWELSNKADTTLGRFIIKLGKQFSKYRSEEAKRGMIIKKFNEYFGEFIRKEDLPEGMKLDEVLAHLLIDPSKEPLKEFSWSTMFVGGMHFQDAYNYDVERVMRCVIHYATPDGRIIPFCAYNSGPTYREAVERKFSVPYDVWMSRHRDVDSSLYQGDVTSSP